MVKDLSPILRLPGFVNAISCEIGGGEWIRTSLEKDGCASTHICPKKDCNLRKENKKE